MRYASRERNTKETQIKISLNLDGNGTASIDTGIGFFNHMLTLFAFQSKIDLTIQARGDLDVCDHHLVEDTGILLGELLLEALGDKVGIERYGNARIPMDETLTYVDLDICNRSYLVFNSEFKRDMIHTYSTEMTKEFMQAFAFNSKMTLHVNTLYGDNDHHKVESIFKALGKALRIAIQVTSNDVSSTKGVL